MGKTDFRGRNAELKLLDDLWFSPHATLLILYGRRRVGKTRLLTHWMERNPRRAIYWVAEPTSALDQLRSFSQTIYNFAHPDTPAPIEFTYANWEQALQQVANLAQEERLALFIDEVTYLIDVNPSIVGTLQKGWDHSLSRSNLMLALSGSQMGLMQNQMLSYQAPLYGRATAQVKLPPLPFAVTEQFFPRYSPEERVAIYAIFGGIPAYWERLNATATIMENVRVQLLTSNTLMQEEPRLLLHDFINDPHNYVGIMRAIAHGAQTQHNISKRTGLSKGHISKYLSVLRDTGFVERQIPVTETGASRRGRYFITDPYLRFYYRFLSAHQSQLALGAQQKTLHAIEEDMPAFIESFTWTELCREWLLLADAHGQTPLPLEDIGSAWRRTHAFDVVGVHHGEKNLILGNCQWGDNPADVDFIEEMAARMPPLVPNRGKWTVYFLGFAANGWTEEAAAQAEQIVMRKKSSNQWQVAGIKLLDLNQVNTDLARWTVSAN